MPITEYLQVDGGQSIGKIVAKIRYGSMMYTMAHRLNLDFRPQSHHIKFKEKNIFECMTLFL